MKAKLIKENGHYFLEVEPNIVYSTKGDIVQLSLKNCQAIELGYDLMKLAEENSNKYYDIKTTDWHCNYNGFFSGFQKALELMGDKKFTEEDIHEAYFLGERDDRGGLHDILKSQEQHEWDVEIETIEYGLGNDNDGRPVYETRCLLDADSCLILKRI